MKKTKLEKGITLVALIITIVVLLILAVVSIGSIRESKIIGHAKNASDEYTIAQEKEKILLAWAEYKIKQKVDSDASFSISGADIEQVNNYGYKVTYTDTNNMYGINSNGEYDEAIDIIIKTSKTTGVDVSKFIIFEDKTAIELNKQNSNVSNYDKIPEKYVFYNWATVTDDERRNLELYNSTSSTELVVDASNRIFILDTNGDGKFTYSSSSNIEEYNKSDNYMVRLCEASSYPPSGNTYAKIMTDEIERFYQEICLYNGELISTIFDEENGGYEYKFSEWLYSFLWDFGITDFDSIGYSFNVSMAYMAYIDNGIINDTKQESYFRSIYCNHPYYDSERSDLNNS